MSRLLSFYGERFSTVEAHSTHRRLPTPAALARWTSSVPPEFRFAPKAHAGITHRRDLEGVGDRIAAFAGSLAPLGDRLGPVLFVLPHRRPDLTRLDLLLAALAELPALRPVFELAPAWWTDDVLSRLDRHRASLAVVDKDGGVPVETRWPPVGPVAYVRLRRQSYSDSQLSEWARRLLEDAPSRPGGSYAFVKHDDRGDAPRYARALVEHLEAP